MSKIQSVVRGRLNAAVEYIITSIRDECFSFFLFFLTRVISNFEYCEGSLLDGNDILYEADSQKENIRDKSGTLLTRVQLGSIIHDVW